MALIATSGMPRLLMCGLVLVFASGFSGVGWGMSMAVAAEEAAAAAKPTQGERCAALAAEGGLTSCEYKKSSMRYFVEEPGGFLQARVYLRWVNRLRAIERP